jgi:hypothetical protein
MQPVEQRPVLRGDAIDVRLRGLLHGAHGSIVPHSLARATFVGCSQGGASYGPGADTAYGPK